MAKGLADGSGRRRYDQQLAERGVRLGFRLAEDPHAECYFCDGVGVTDSKEHIFATWMQKALGASNEVFTPTYYNGGQALDERGPIPAANLVTKGICVDCNTGWMNDLEVQFRPFIMREPGGSDLFAVVSWFVKTAFVLNVSQNTRLLVPRDARLSLAAGVLDPRISVYVHRVPYPEPGGGQINWVQNASFAPVSYPPSLKDLWFDEIKYIWACTIRLRNIAVTVVLNTPQSRFYSSWDCKGSVACARGEIRRRIRWQRLPETRHFSNGVFLVPESLDWCDAKAVREGMWPKPSGVDGVLELNAYVAEVSRRLAIENGMPVEVRRGSPEPLPAERPKGFT